MTATTTLTKKSITTKTSKVGDAVSASVNEQNFFASMKHLFSGSFSILGELMQNARRAGATRIDFVLDTERKTLSIRDDGIGIEDFGVLIKLCESGWDKKTVEAENPFGMGLFSLFYAAEQVTFRSRSKKLVLTLEDIISKTEVTIQDNESYYPATGSIVELAGLSDDLLKPERYHADKTMGELSKYQLTHEIQHRAKGFPIAVFINGVACKRPHAISDIIGTQCDIGFVSIDGIHNSAHSIARPNGREALYLQGLPIGQCYDARVVVHLEQSKFAAVMPDRSRLYDADAQNLIIQQCLIEVGRDFLRAQKAKLGGEYFVKLHTADCSDFDCTELLNDIPFLRCKDLQHVDCVSADSGNVWLHNFDVENETVSKEQVLSGSVKIWIAAPDYSTQSGLAMVILQAMEGLEVAKLAIDLDPGHWVYAVCPSVDDLVFNVSVVNAHGDDAVFFDTGDFASSQMKLADKVTLKITGADYEQELAVTNGLIVVPDQMPESGVFKYPKEGGTISYLVNCSHAENPVDMFRDFQDDNGRFQDDWRDDAVAEWDIARAKLEGYEFERVVDMALSSADVALTAKHAGHMCLVAEGMASQPSLKTIDLEDILFWDRVAAIWKDIGSDFDQERGGAPAALKASMRAAASEWQAK
jgi:hypothetical protein